MGLLDFFQGASNAAAGNVSGPVDAIAWALRKAGVPVGDAPMGSSQWMEQMGLTRPANGYAGLLGEAAGLSMPIVAAAKAPQIARGLLSLDDKAMDMARQGVERAMLANGGIQPATVWHGGPHKFDKFDSSKIGTGEGAQAYGHGLYLADAPEVAKDYAKKLSSAGLAKHALTQSGGQIDDAIAQASQSVQNYQTLIAKGGGGDMRRANGMLALAQKKLADLQSMKAGALDEAGNLYKVDLPDEQIAKMLDWDKPLSQQAHLLPVVQQARPGYMTGGLPNDGIGGADAYLALVEKVGEAKAAEMMRKAGIPGIRYLDGGSRGAGTGTSNYVIFPGNENMLTILERNGQPVSNLGLGK